MGFMIIKRPHTLTDACAKITNGDKEISIACDDSCGSMKHLGRSDIRCFIGDNDLTREVFPENLVDGTMFNVWGTLENLERAIAWLKK